MWGILLVLFSRHCSNVNIDEVYRDVLKQHRTVGNQFQSKRKLVDIKSNFYFKIQNTWKKLLFNLITLYKHTQLKNTSPMQDSFWLERVLSGLFVKTAQDSELICCTHERLICHPTSLQIILCERFLPLRKSLVFSFFLLSYGLLFLFLFFTTRSLLWQYCITIIRATTL